MLTPLLIFFVISPPSPAAEPPPFATVIGVHGKASLEPAHTNLMSEQKLPEGSRVQVMSDSWLRLKLYDGSVMQVGPLSDLELKRNTTTKNPLLRLFHGMILSVVKPGKGADAKKERYQIRTNKVSMGVRGTEFFVKQNGDEPTFLCVCSGKVHAQWDKGETLIEAKHHDHPVNIFPHKKKADGVKDMGSEHTDKEIEELQQLL